MPWSDKYSPWTAEPPSKACRGRTTRRLAVADLLDRHSSQAHFGNLRGGRHRFLAPRGNGSLPGRINQQELSVTRRSDWRVSAIFIRFGAPRPRHSIWFE